MSRYIGNYLRVPSSEPQQASAPGVWSISEQLAYQRANLWPPARDPYYNQTVLHLSGDVAGTKETNPVTQPRTFLSDASSNNFLLTPNGDVSARPFNPYMGSNYSTYFDGIDDALTVAGNAALDLTGDFTIEFWANMQGNTNYLCNGTQTGSGCWRLVLTASTGTAQFDMAIGSWAGLTLTSAAGLFTKNVWTHFAITRSANIFRLFINGIQAAIGTNSGSLINTGRSTQIGYYSESSGTYYSQWYLSNLRIINGTAVYTTGFSPSTIPLIAITNTSLLTCQSNRLIDNSSNNFSVTPSSTPVVAQNSPFVSLDTTSGSGYFDGSGDYLTAPASNIVDFAAGQAFTFECWFYPTTSAVMAITQGGANTFSIDITPGSSGSINYGKAGVLNIISGSVSMPVGTWNHLAIARNTSNQSRMWVNGASIGSSSGDSYSFNNAVQYIGSNANPGAYFVGYLSNIRVVKGTALYNPTLSSNIIVPTAPLTPVTNTSLLTLQTRAPANNQGILDTSPNSLVVTRTGNVAQGSFSPFSPGGWSNFLDGSTAYFTVAANSAINDFGTGDFNMELWFYATSANFAAEPSLLCCAVTWATSVAYQFEIRTGGIVYFFGGDSVPININSGATTVSVNTWNHVAASRASGTTRLFVNGTQVSSTNAAATISKSSTAVIIGAFFNAAQKFTGYLSNIRIVKGQALYTGNFTPPTAALTTTSVGTSGANVATSVTGTVGLLTCQSNRFLDQTGKTITVTGSPSVQPFSPFAPTQAYVASQLGGSAYFDASGDSIAITSSIVNPSGTEDFTLEFWFYHTMSSWPGGFLYYITGTGSGTFGIYYNNAQNEIVVQQSGVTQIINTAVSNTPLNQWNHYALVRSSNSWAVWINGTRTSGPITNSTSFNAATGFSISPTNAYVSGFRIVKQPLYLTSQSTIPVPTAPPQAVNNTTTLLNFTGAGIVDSTGKNVVETVNNSAVQTTQSKWPPGSMYFDGSGDYLSLLATPNLAFGSGPYTVEAWVNFAVLPTSGNVAPIYQNGTHQSGTVFHEMVVLNDAGVYKLLCNLYNGSSYVYQPQLTFTPSIGVWYHFAFIYTGITAYAAINGALSTGVTASGTCPNSTVFIGYQVYTGGGQFYFNGYIEDLRITKGYTRYVAGTGGNAGQMVFNGTNTIAIPTLPFLLA